MEWSDHLEKLEKVFDSEAKAKEYVERKGGDYMMKEVTVEQEQAMKVFIVTKQGHEVTLILGVFAKKELAQERIDWSREVFDQESHYDIVEETVIEKQ